MNLEQLKQLKEKAQKQIALREGGKKYRVTISMGTSGIAAGAREVMKTMLDEIEKHGLDEVEVHVTGEHGLENIEPVVQVEEAGGEKDGIIPKWHGGGVCRAAVPGARGKVRAPAR